MNWLALIFAFEMGMTPQVDVLAYNEYVDADTISWGVYYTQLEAEAEAWDLLFIGGTVRTYILPSDVLSFSPRQAVYDFNVGLRWQPFELGWRHRCFHPIMPYMPLLDVDVRGLEGGYDELYVRVKMQR